MKDALFCLFHQCFEAEQVVSGQDKLSRIISQHNIEDELDEYELSFVNGGVEQIQNRVKDNILARLGQKTF